MAAKAIELLAPLEARDTSIALDTAPHEPGRVSLSVNLALRSG